MPDENPLMPVRAKIGFRSDVRYDINLAVLTHCAGRDLHRVHCMKKYGVVNPGELKVHITLLVSPGDFDFVEDLYQDWIATADVSVLEMPLRFPIPKINGYYLWLMEQGPVARWHGRVDDDSITDLTEALRYLDSRFGDAEVHVATGPLTMNEHEPLFVPYLLERGIYPAKAFTEWESSFTSAAAMARIFSNENARSMIVETATLFRTPGDRALAFAAHISGVAVVENHASRWGFEFGRLTLLGGDLHHIHYVPWGNPEILRMIAAFFAVAELDLGEIEVQEVIGLPVCLDSASRASALVTLTPDGELIGGEDMGVERWDFESGMLRLLSMSGDEVVSFGQFTRGQSGLIFQGRGADGQTAYVMRQPEIQFPNDKDTLSPEGDPEASFPRYGRYFRLGHDSRLMYFSSDGGIGAGQAAFERRWRMVKDSGNPVVNIEGDAGVTCSLERHEDGIWRGRWTFAEKMPVAVIPFPWPPTHRLK